jgi:hypothetical protein
MPRRSSSLRVSSAPATTSITRARGSDALHALTVLLRGRAGEEGAKPAGSAFQGDACGDEARHGHGLGGRDGAQGSGDAGPVGGFVRGGARGGRRGRRGVSRRRRGRRGNHRGRRWRRRGRGRRGRRRGRRGGSSYAPGPYPELQALPKNHGLVVQGPGGEALERPLTQQGCDLSGGDMLGQERPITGAIMNPWPMKPDARVTFDRARRRADDGFAVGREVVAAGPLPQHLDAREARHAAHERLRVDRQELLATTPVDARAARGRWRRRPRSLRASTARSRARP